MKTVHIILPFLCFIFTLCFIPISCLIFFDEEMEPRDFSFFSSNKGESEIIKFIDPGSKHIYDDAMSVNFAIFNPPKNKDSLLSLVSNHFQSFTSNDTIKKYRYYSHGYYKETQFTRHDYIEKRKGYSFYLDYLSDRRKDLLITIVVDTKNNEQIIGFHHKRNESVIRKMWKTE